jgi:drug/metabolite transporter (DMT)-like permease
MPSSIILALISGLGFGGFLILIAQAQHGAVFWPLAVARVASLSLVALWAVTRRSIQVPPRNAFVPIASAGVMDAAGNLFFVLSSQAGRLDIAGVLSSLYPAATVILALTLLRERLIRSQAFGIVLAILAIPLISI